MLHPDTELGAVSPDIGVGIFASTFIPKGAIIYIKDPLEIEIEDGDPRLLDPDLRLIIDRYSYLEASGKRVLSWDLAKYMNHSCNPNSLSTGYGFEIAVRDIHAGEEITDDYGLLNVEQDLRCYCNAHQCREWIRSDDIQRYFRSWDEQTREALLYFSAVRQPLAKFLDENTRMQLQQFLDTGKSFASVKHLQMFTDRLSLTTGNTAREIQEQNSDLDFV